jgi:hypothetical protein
VPDSDDWNFGSGDFTIDGWVYFPSISSADLRMSIASQYVDINNRWIFYVETNGTTDHYVQFMHMDGGTRRAYYYTQVSSLFTPGTWQHVAFVRNGNSAYIFVGGVSRSLTTITSWGALSDVGAGALNVGHTQFDGYYQNGYLDELRISKGIARWTSNFTPPTSAYTSTGSDVILK